MLFYFPLYFLIKSCYSSCIVVEYMCTGDAVDYMQANRDDCSRFVHCAFGVASYWQCRRGFVFDSCQQTCVRVTSNNPRYECFNATNNQCVVQKERPYDLLQADAEPETNTLLPPVVPSSQPPIISPFLPGILPTSSLQPTPLSPYNPFLYGPGLGISSGGMGFNLNLNYNPLIGWGLNSNLALETPWSTMLAPLLGLPMYPPVGMPYGGMNVIPGAGMGMIPGAGMGLLPGIPFPPMFRKPRPKNYQLVTPKKINAVQVNACVPSNPWPGNTTPITPTPKINETSR